MSKQVYEGVQISSLSDLARTIFEAHSKTKIWAFYGSMGAGKTTFIKQLCKFMGVEEPVLSPTFAIVNEYATTSNEPVFHFDFYRIKTIEEAYDIGYEEYFFSNNYCFIEWPEKIEELLKIPHLRIEINEIGDDIRKFTVEEVG